MIIWLIVSLTIVLIVKIIARLRYLSVVL